MLSVHVGKEAAEQSPPAHAAVQSADHLEVQSSRRPAPPAEESSAPGTYTNEKTEVRVSLQPDCEGCRFGLQGASQPTVCELPSGCVSPAPLTGLQNH